MKLSRIFSCFAAIVLCTSNVNAQSPKRYLVTVRDVPDTGIVVQRGRHLGHDAKTITKRTVLVIENRGRGRPGLIDSLNVLKRSRRTSQGAETMYIEEDLLLPLMLPSDGPAVPLDADPTWSVQAIHAVEAWKLGYMGAGVITAALDGAGGWGHPGINIAGGWNALSNTPDTSQGYQVDTNCNSHGVHTASSMSGNLQGGVGNAPASSVLMIRVFELTGSCVAYTSSTLRGAMYAADHGATVLNVSIAHSFCFSCAQTAADLKARGVIFFGANGNSGATPPYWPAQDSNSVGSAAIDAAGNRASWSNYGPTTDFGSPGVGVVGALQGGGYGSKSGTSMASPTTAGGYAILRAGFPAKTTTELISAMKITADSLPGARPNDMTGWGRPNIAKAIAYLKGGVAVSWTSRTYTSDVPIIDSVFTSCVLNCYATYPNTITIQANRNGYVVFQAVSPGGNISITSNP
jgi:subtilisin family serine protease